MIFKGLAKDRNCSGVYVIKNIINNKIYVGSALCFRIRFNAHRTKLELKQHHNKHLTASYHKYGKEAFEFEIIEICEKEQVLIREQYYIDTLKPVYNKQQKAGAIRFGRKGSGKGGFKKGYLLSETTIKRRQEAVKRRQAAGTIIYRKPHSEESKQRMAKAGLLHRFKKAKLSVEQVKEIKELLKENVSLLDIAKKYNMSSSAIGKIKRKQIWADIV